MGTNSALEGQVVKFRNMPPEKAVERLKDGFFQMTGQRASIEQQLAWRGTWAKLLKVFLALPDDAWIALEYRLPLSHERIDVLLLGHKGDGKPIAVIGEFKGWGWVKAVKGWLVEADGEIHQHPEFQVLNYLGKVRNSHSASDTFDLLGFAWLYHLPQSALTFQTVPAFFAGDDEGVRRFLASTIVGGLPDKVAQQFLQGTYTQTLHLFDAIAKNFEVLQKGALEALCATGFAPSEEQHRLLEEILECLNDSPEPVAFLVQGAPGSGKSYLAVLLLLEVLRRAGKMETKRQNVAVLGYRNNRFINTVRQIFKTVAPGLDAAIQFSYTGSNRHPGIAERHDITWDLVIYDEAQRLREHLLVNAVQRGRKVSVFFYDESQRLNVEEAGTLGNLLQAAKEAGYSVREYQLRGVYRVRGGQAYHDFVEQLLTDPLRIRGPLTFPGYEFHVFNDIEEMLTALRTKAREDFQVALVAAFTEAPGDRKNPCGRTPKNLRVGYPLWSGFEHYKGKSVAIYWLMDPRNQYPAFWYGRQSNALTHCASIYGCQGFEVDYVGVIWGRDFVWRGSRWALGDNCEDDIRPQDPSAKDFPSLKELFQRRDEQNALPLLVNRYRIFLTRGIHGTFVYCEDLETAQLLRQLQRCIGTR